MHKKLALFILVLFCYFTLNACGDSSPNAGLAGGKPIQEIATPSSTSSVRVSIADFEIHVEVVDNVPLFWVTNNSEYTITGPKLKLRNKDTGEILTAYEWRSTIKPGETSSVVEFYKDNDAKVAPAEVQNATWLTFEANYKNDDETVDAWFEYNFISKAIRGFDY